MDNQLLQQLDLLKKDLENHLDTKMLPLNEWKANKEKADELNQKALDKLLLNSQRVPIPGYENKSFGNVFATKIAEEFERREQEFKAFQNNKNARLTFELKTVGTMTLGASLTGDAQGSYNPRQGLVPNQRINFRDLIPFVQSPTGIYVTYQETGGEGAVDVQTEGQTKAQLDYDYTEIKNVSNYVAGFVRFSKQLMYNLPWLQSTLTRLLLRDFYKKENALFYATVAADATGFDTYSSATDVEGLIDLLMGRADTDFNNSFILVKNSEKGEILKMLFTNGYYAGSGSVLGMPDGSIRIADVPIIGASWADAGKIMIIDADYLERVETESLRVEFSYEDSDNFQRNLITGRIECFEDLNLLRTDAHTYVSSPTGGS